MESGVKNETKYLYIIQYGIYMKFNIKYLIGHWINYDAALVLTRPIRTNLKLLLFH